jgi:large subunit ribosomal protein L40e
MASIIGANVHVLSTRITLTTPKEGDAEEELYLDFQFSPEKGATLQDILAAARSEWKHKNLVLADPGNFLLDVEVIDWDYVGGDKVDFMGTEVERSMAKSKNSKGKDLLKCIKRMGVGVCDGDRVVVLPTADGTCNLYRTTTPTPSKDTLQSLVHRVNEFHANVGVELKALPEINSIEWDVEGEECTIIPLSMLSSDFPTVGDLKRAIINSVRCPSHVKYNLVINTPGGDTWRQQNDTDDKLLIQELGLPGPGLQVTMTAKNADFPNIEGLRWVIDEKEYHVPLSMLPSDLPTVGDVSNAFRNAHQIPSECIGNLVLTAPDGSTWYQYTDRDEKLLIQELGLPGPIVKVALSNKRYDIILKTQMEKCLTFGVYAFTSVRQFMAMIEEKEEIPPNQQRLIFRGRRLDEDHLTMRDYGILNADTVHLVLSLCGGMYHETSARQDFAVLADTDSTQISITLLFPDGDETNVSVSPWTEVTNLKALAISTLSCKPHAKKQKVQSERE